MKIEALEPFGYEISDLDLKQVTETEFADIHAAFADAGIVFFRDQDLAPADHITLARRFGEININRFFTPHPDYPEVALVVKEPAQTTNIGGTWHTDHSYDEVPALGSILLAHEVPPTGGNTQFASMYRTWERLSPGLQTTLEGMRAVHSAHHVFGTKNPHQDSDDAGARRIHNADVADRLPDPVHPVVIKHPISGKKALYVNPQFTLRFEGWSDADSRPLLDYLGVLATEEAELCEFEWRVGSIALWDNRATWHNARNDYQGHRRVMHRITIEGCALDAA